MSNSLDKIACDFADKAGTGKPLISDRGSNVTTGHYRGRDTIFSYGSHFPMAVMMPGEDGPRGWFLVNGDKYSVSTSRHQGAVRAAIKATGLPSVIMSFSALNRAGVKQESLTVVERQDERYTWEHRTRDAAYARDYGFDTQDLPRPPRLLEDGLWHYEAAVHHLGEAVFRAEYTYEERTPGYHDFETHNWVPGTYKPHTGEALFLSAFDDQEGFGLYFMCQLPDGTTASTVAEAFEALKPPAVVLAEKAGIPVLRQGDVFAVPSEFKTQDLPGPGKHSAYVLETNHVATEVRTDGTGSTYGRGWLRHKPAHRRPDHHAVKLGDGKGWYHLVRNTVPEGRAWSLQGNVD